jgi:hypothetical protein
VENLHYTNRYALFQMEIINLDRGKEASPKDNFPLEFLYAKDYFLIIVFPLLLRKLTG